MIKISNVIEIQIKLPRSIVTTKLVGEFLNVDVKRLISLIPQKHELYVVL